MCVAQPYAFIPTPTTGSLLSSLLSLLSFVSDPHVDSKV